MAEAKEADRLPDHVDHYESSDQGDFNENEAPGDSHEKILIASDSYEDLNYDDIAVSSFGKPYSGSIIDIVRHNSCSDEKEADASSLNLINESSAESSNEDQNEGQVKDLSADKVPEDVGEGMKLEIRENEDFGPEWRQKKKHLFIFSSAGKPIYSRHGSEDKLVTIMGVMQALVSFVQVSGDNMRCIIAGDHKFIFLNRDQIVLVGVSSAGDSSTQIVLQLSYVYNQIISVLTYTSLHKIFKQRRNYDLRRLLSGAEKFIDNLVNMMDTEPGFLLGAIRCLPLDAPVREMIEQTIVLNAKVKDLVFAVMLANNQLISLVRMKKYFLSAMDLHLIINLVNASESFKTAESWTPICLPKFDSSGFLQAHISYLDENSQTCLLLLSVDREAFFTLSECKNKIQERLLKYNSLRAISDSLATTSYSIQQCGITDLRHFLYKSKSIAQYTSPELEAPYLTPADQERLFGLYHYLHHRIHSPARPLKILYYVGEQETLLGWMTQGFELYTVFGPLVTKTNAIHAINKLLRWIKKEEDQLFILNSVTF